MWRRVCMCENFCSCIHPTCSHLLWRWCLFQGDSLTCSCFDNIKKKTFSHYQWDNFHFYGLLLQIYPFFALALRSNKTCRVKILWRMDVHDNGMCLLRPCGFHSRDIITQCTKLAFKVVKLPLSTLYFDFRLSLTLPAFLH